MLNATQANTSGKTPLEGYFPSTEHLRVEGRCPRLQLPLGGGNGAGLPGGQLGVPGTVDELG